MPQGKVKWFSTEKAYGFIAQENDNDIFVHVTGLAEGVTTLEPDQVVEFEVVQGRKGQQAANVRPATQAAPARPRRRRPRRRKMKRRRPRRRKMRPPRRLRPKRPPRSGRGRKRPRSEEAEAEEAEPAEDEPVAEEAAEEPASDASPRAPSRSDRHRSDPAGRPPDRARSVRRPPRRLSALFGYDGRGSVSRRRGTMLDTIHWLGHDSVPHRRQQHALRRSLEAPRRSAAADVVLVTHDHYDHLSADDIEKLAGAGTVVVGPAGGHRHGPRPARPSPSARARPSRPAPPRVTAVPAYNVNKFKQAGRRLPSPRRGPRRLHRRHGRPAHLPRRRHRRDPRDARRSTSTWRCCPWAAPTR